MACTPLTIDLGLFLTTSPWETTPSRSFDGKTVTHTPGGPNPGITVQKSGSSPIFHAQLANRSLFYGVLGNKYLLILDAETGGGTSTRSVSLVNFDSMTEIPLLTVLASSNAVPLPVLNPSQGTGSAFLLYGQDGTQQVAVAIYRSDTGAILCSLGSITATGQTVGEATATDVLIHYTAGGGSNTKTCPKPLGKAAITPAVQVFPDVFIGGCPFTPPTRQFVIRNNGTDCLTVNPIAGVTPFSIQSTSPALPATLSPGQQVDVTVAFNPTAAGNWNPLNIPVSTTPALGDNKLVCRGQTVAADFNIGFSAVTFNFGKQPVGQNTTKTLVITNTGHKAMSVSSGGVVSDGFTVAPFSGFLTCGQTLSVNVLFDAASEGSHAASFSVTHSAAGSPTTIHLAGEGCVANAEIFIVPPAAPISFGQIQRGFRTVRWFKVTNPADGPLFFQGALSGANAALFGLPDPNGSVISPPANRSYTVDPVAPCGSLTTGSGETVVAISFFADAAPGLVNATLTLSGHNATNVPASKTWVFPLSAEITPPVALDVALVVDRSDSMNDHLGSRVKMDAAISASQLFVELLRPNLDDRIAVARFNNDRNVVVPIAAVSTTTAPTQSDVLQSIGGIPPATGLTAIAGGTMLGVHEVQTPHPGNPSPLNKAVVVLTDGIENTAFEEPAGNWLSLRGGKKYTPTATTTDDTVDTSAVVWPPDIERWVIGVGKPGEVNPDDLNAAAGDPQRVFYVDQDLTGVQYFQLEKYYTQIFMHLVGTQPVVDPMYWIASGDTHEHEFEVLAGDREALVVIYDYEGNRLPFFCFSPKGELIDPSSIPAGFELRPGFTREARLLDFKMPLQEPDRYAGTWKVVVVHGGIVCRGTPNLKSERRGFLPRDCHDQVKDPLLYGIAIGVGSDFRMFPYVTPSPVYTGDPILLTAVVSEAGLPVRGCTVTAEATSPGGAVSTYTLFDDGAHMDSGADDGEYAYLFTQTFAPGIYHFKFRAVGMSREGKQVVREAVRDKPVLLRGGTGDGGRPGGTGPGGGQPGDGPPPPPDDCCKELLREIRLQNEYLRKLLR